MRMQTPKQKAELIKYHLMCGKSKREVMNMMDLGDVEFNTIDKEFGVAKYEIAEGTVSDPDGHFYNTTGESDPTLKKSKVKAGKQTITVRRFFQSNPGLALTPFEVLQELQAEDLVDVNVPVTSIRRAITDLTEAGVLVKTDEKRLGNYGAMNNTWRLNKA